MSGKPPSAPLSNGRSLPLEFGGDIVAWAAWLYYVEELTQNDVAARLGVSRATVANYLGEARQRGLVTISVDAGMLARMQVSQALARLHGLVGAFVIPASGTPVGAGDDPSLARRLGTAGARILIDRLGRDDILGVAWGRTVHALAEALPERRMPEVRVVQVAGSSLGGDDFSPEFCTATIAARLGARCMNLHAPAFVSSQSLRDSLKAEPALKKQFALIDRCDRIVFGVGALEETSTFADTSFLPPNTAADYLSRGAVGAALGRFIDAQGRETPGPLQHRIIAIDIDTLKAAPERICIAGGPEKITALRAALRGGFATHLITDMLTARGLLEDQGAAE